MHPILARSGRLALYLCGWAGVGLLLTALVAGTGRLGWGVSLAIAMPLALAYAFVCLSAWYVSRSTPIGPTGTVRVVTTAVTAAVISSGAWLILARGWLELF